ncbi:MAG: cbb3-type cytochrome oxidase assembly protein CcoS [Lentisphaeraceae bacterium]|nr:cbb3-type cytochrome oxidase assembly protein CcoS [Lentisphaeraceae bacterium]MCM8537962.1 cbb3-type cytochrome oxidase assembly protein CcoS [Lentisphaeraceae bacterium]
MSIIYPLAILAIILAGFFLVAFLFALHSGQFDDTQTPAQRMLLDDGDQTQSPISKKQNLNSNRRDK